MRPLIHPETVELAGALPKVTWEDDFTYSTAALMAAGGHWVLTDTGAATEALVGDAVGGVMALTLDATSETQVAVMDFGNERAWPVQGGLIFEARVKLAVLPSGATSLMRFGVAADHNGTFNSNTHHAWFGAEGNGLIFCETDDASTDTDDKTSGVTVLATEWKTYRIDCRDYTDVKFYIDNVQVATSTTFAAAAAVNLQPYFACLKTSTTVGTMYIDYVRLACDRAA